MSYDKYWLSVAIGKEEPDSNDPFTKTEGGAAAGAPDRDDWIIDCRSPQLIYQRVCRAIEALRVMLAEQ